MQIYDLKNITSYTKAFFSFLENDTSLLQDVIGNLKNFTKTLPIESALSINKMNNIERKAFLQKIKYHTIQNDKLSVEETFICELIKNRRLHLLFFIVKELERIHNTLINNSLVKIHIADANMQNDKHFQNKIESLLKKWGHDKKWTIEYKIDPNIISGFIIKVDNEQVIDLSFFKKSQQLMKSVI